MEKDKLAWTYKELKKSPYPIFIWGAGIMSVKVEKRLAEQGIKSEGFFVNVNPDSVNILSEIKKVYSLEELAMAYDKIDVVMGHGHYEKKDLIANLPLVHEVYIIANPYLQYRSTGINDYIQQHKSAYENIVNRLADDASRKALHAYCMVNETNDIDYLLQGDFFVNDIFGFPALNLSHTERFLDIGAWTGDTIALFLEKTQHQYEHIFGIEPNPSSFEQLREYAVEMENCSLFPCGLADKEGVLFLHMDDETSQSDYTSTEQATAGQVQVKVKTLDTLFEKEAFSLIKLCVPTVFPEILQGGRKCITRDKPRLIIALSPENGTRFFDVIQWLMDLDIGYHIALRFDFPMPTRLWLYAY